MTLTMSPLWPHKVQRVTPDIDVQNTIIQLHQELEQRRQQLSTQATGIKEAQGMQKEIVNTNQKYAKQENMQKTLESSPR